ncbi:MAG: long-chain fatty acid--CoA ligase [Actinomycetota bacterium]
MTTRSYDWIAHHARTRPDAVAQRDLATGRSFIWAEMEARTTSLASALASDLEVRAGDRVAVLANNTTNTFEVQFACWKLGAVFVPLNWRLALPELEYILGDCSPAVLVHDDEFADTATKLAERCSIRTCIDMDGSDATAIDYEELLASADAAVELAPTTHETPLMIMYTSGTTGRPKGAQITQGMTLWNAVNCTEFFGIRAGMINLVCLPLFHTGGLNVFANPAFHVGGQVVIARSFDPAATLAMLSDPEAGITHFLGVPANYVFMAQLPEFEDATFPTVEVAGVGGAPTPEPLIERWAGKGLPLQQMYGMTETGPVVTALKPEDAAVKIGSAGLPMMHCEVRVVAEDGNDVVPGERGELWVRGPAITPAYWNRPEANEQSFEGGWFKTGDAVSADDDGFLYVVDRWKDMYISGGENVYPAEVESVMYQLDDVVEVAVIGVPDERWGEVGRAIAVIRDGSELTEKAILDHCRANLARFKVPRSVVFIDELPHNATGKILKRELRLTHSG